METRPADSFQMSGFDAPWDCFMSDKESTTTDGESSEGLPPMEGGRWRPVKPEELLRRHPVVDPDEVDDPRVDQPNPKVTLERRQTLEHHLKQSPTDLEAYLELGRIYRVENRPADSRRVLRQAADIFPEEEEVRWELEEAMLARSLQQLREVTELAERLDTVETEHELQRCNADWAARRIEVCRARLERNPSLHHLRVSLAEAMYDADEFSDALAELDDVLEIDDLSPAAYLLRGRCLLQAGKDLDAMVALRAAAMRRAVVAPLPIRVLALRLLCEVAERLGVQQTLLQYQQQLRQSEQELAKSRASKSH
jgi:tetratricopeptide (TPR) repeat protein